MMAGGAAAAGREREQETGFLPFFFADNIGKLLGGDALRAGAGATSSGEGARMKTGDGATPGSVQPHMRGPGPKDGGNKRQAEAAISFSPGKCSCGTVGPIFGCSFPQIWWFSFCDIIPDCQEFRETTDK